MKRLRLVYDTTDVTFEKSTMAYDDTMMRCLVLSTPVSCARNSFYMAFF